ncbi:hypothetical protein [Devosia sp. Root635]|uniref:hypothetical protein n=1 Tax=Devosia sp. Root635 TaxID=1736575 RepID=UPI0006F2D412|nr:hypothetical protein [Devosia sp. Root635]KRA55349.1 hypothetical protein ASD80_13135 [Devosia sp. Root635]
MDLAVIAAESWLILILLPILVGVAFFVSTLDQQADSLAIATSPFNSTISQTALGEIVDDVLGPSDTRQVRRSGGNVTIVSLDRDVAHIAAEVRATMVALSEIPAYSEAQIAETNQLLEETAGRLEALEVLFQKLEGLELGGGPTGADQAFSTGAEFVSAFLALDSRISELKSTQRSLRKALDLRLVTTPDVDIVIQSPPKQDASTPILMAIATALLVFGLLVARAMWRSASTDPLKAIKLNRIRRAFFVFGRR